MPADTLTTQTLIGMATRLGALEEAMRNASNSRRQLHEAADAQREVSHEHSGLLRQIKDSLDKLAGPDGRVAKVEAVTADYTRNKNRVLGVIAGAGFGGGGLVAGLHQLHEWWKS